MTKRFETETYTAPACWASYLINGDASGLDYYNTPDSDAGDEEIAAADAFIADVGLGAPVDCSESEFMHRGDYGSLAGDYCTYSFLRDTEKNPAPEWRGVDAMLAEQDALPSEDDES